jgi:hypothetical protein
MSGRAARQCATRSFSRAALSASPTRHDSQWAQLVAPCSYQPPHSSKARISVSNRCVAASMWAAVAAIRSPSASISARDKRGSEALGWGGPDWAS